MALTLFTNLFQRIDRVIEDITSSPLSGFITEASLLIPSILTLWIIMRAITAYRGRESLSNFFFDTIGVVLIISLSTVLISFNMIFTDVFTGAGDYFAGKAIESFNIKSAIFKNGVGSAGSAIDFVTTDFIKVVNKAVGDFSIWDSKSILTSLLVCFLFFFYVIMLVILIYNIGLAKLGTALLLVIGPFFVLSLMFKSTRSFFTQWLMFIIQFQLMIVISMLVFVIFYKIGVFSSQTFELSDLTSYLMPTVMVGVAIAMLRQTPQIAMALSGGISLSVDSAINKTLDTIKGTGKMAKNVGAKALKKVNPLNSNRATKMKDALLTSIENKGLPTFRAAAEKQRAFELLREEERDLRIAQYQQEILHPKKSKDTPTERSPNSKDQPIENVQNSNDQPIENVQNSNNQSIETAQDSNDKHVENTHSHETVQNNHETHDKPMETQEHQTPLQANVTINQQDNDNTNRHVINESKVNVNQTAAQDNNSAVQSKISDDLNSLRNSATNEQIRQSVKGDDVTIIKKGDDNKQTNQNAVDRDRSNREVNIGKAKIKEAEIENIKIKEDQKDLRRQSGNSPIELAKNQRMSKRRQSTFEQARKERRESAVIEKSKKDD